MTDVAVVVREDTGVIESSESRDLSAISHVRCDSCKTVRPIQNAYLLDEARGGGHSFDGADFDPDCYADERHRVVVYFYKNKKGKRVAKYHYIPKGKYDRKPDDPFYLTVVEGRKFIVTIGKMKSAAGM
jgi:hypothetical protein